MENGWPASIKQVDKDICEFWSMKDDISIVDGLVLVGSRILIPSIVREPYAAFTKATKARSNANCVQRMRSTGREYIKTLRIWLKHVVRVRNTATHKPDAQ